MTRLEKTISDVIPRRLRAYGWGKHLEGSKYAIYDVRGLHLAAGNLRYILKDESARLYYRGQAESYPTGIVPSLYRGAQTLEERIERDEKVERAIRTIKSKANWDPKGTAGQSEALAQHYGMRTRWLDVVDHLQSAAWFAYDSDKAHADDGVGYIYLIAISRETAHEVVDLRERGSNWIRPHIQQGFGIATTALAPNVNDCVVATFVVPRVLLRAASGYDFYTRDTFFPPSGQDQGRHYWIQAADALRSEVSEADFKLLIWSDGR